MSPLIHTALWDEDPAVRVEAAVALWKIDRNKGPLVIPALIKALANDNELICWIAADYLGQIGPEAREAVPALRQALRRPFKIGLIRKGVALALQRFDGQTTAAAACRAGLTAARNAVPFLSMAFQTEAAVSDKLEKCS